MLSDTQMSLVQQVLAHGPVSRSQLTRSLGMSPSSLTRLVKPFISEGIFLELDEHRDGSMGRPVRPVAVNPQAAHVVGIRLTPGETHTVITDLLASVVEDRVDRLDTRRATTVVEHIVRLVAAAQELVGSSLAAVGVTLRGNIDNNGVVLNSDVFEWHLVPLLDLLAARLDIPVVVENDIVALTSGEHLFGVGRGVDSFNVIAIGKEIGYGVVIDDRVVTSPDQGLGVADHILLMADGPRCSKGHHGCAYSLLTTVALCAEYLARTDTVVDFYELLDRAANHESVAEEMIDRAGTALGILIALATNLTYSHTVVLTGEAAGVWDLAAGKAWQSISDGRAPAATSPQVLVGPHTADSWARGAAAAGIERFLCGLDIPG